MKVGDLVKYTAKAVDCGCILLINVDRIGMIIATQYIDKPGDGDPVCTIKFFGTGAVTHRLNSYWLEKVE